MHNKRKLKTFSFVYNNYKQLFSRTIQHLLVKFISYYFYSLKTPIKLIFFFLPLDGEFWSRLKKTRLYVGGFRSRLWIAYLLYSPLELALSDSRMWWPCLDSFVLFCFVLFCFSHTRLLCVPNVQVYSLLVMCIACNSWRLRRNPGK